METSKIDNLAQYRMIMIFLNLKKIRSLKKLGLDTKNSVFDLKTGLYIKNYPYILIPRSRIGHPGQYAGNLILVNVLKFYIKCSGSKTKV